MSLPYPLIKRHILPELRTHLDKKEISLLVGPRQVGKTTIMRLLQQELQAAREPTVFLNLDVEEDRPHFFSQEALLKKLSLEFGSQRGVVFIDEIQRQTNAGLFLKGIYDREVPYKLIVSGSGSLELKEKIHESLVGRKRIFPVTPLTFPEVVDFATEYRYTDHLDDFFTTESARTLSLLEEYLQFGGYPAVVVEPQQTERKRIIDEIYGSYVERDIQALLQVDNRAAFTALVKVLAAQAGQLVNYSELANTVGLAVPTIKRYLWYLQKTFILHLLTPYTRNVRKEISRSPLPYFIDLGLRNYACGRFGLAPTSTEAGFLFQNYIFLALQNKFGPAGNELHFWRTLSQAEVDFIAIVDGQPVPIEVKYTSLSRPAVERSLRSFIAKYHPRVALVINKTLATTITIDTTEVRFVPITTWLRSDYVW